MRYKYRENIIGAPSYSHNVRELIKSELKNLRAAFRKQLEDNKLDSDGCNGLVLGKRFDDDMHVITRIEVAMDEHNFLENPVGWIWEMLFECAAADHYYEHEKKY